MYEFVRFLFAVLMNKWSIAEIQMPPGRWHCDTNL